MLQLLSKVKIIDNSGGRAGRCINVVRPGGRKYAKIGDIVLITVKKARPGGRIKKGSLHKAIVVKTKTGIKRKGRWLGKWNSNGVVLIKNNGPIASRIKGGISTYLRRLGRGKKINAIARARA